MTRTSFQTLTLSAIAATAMLASTATPAFAANSNNGAGQTQAADAQSSSARPDRRAGNRRICIVGDITGSRVPRRVCKTEREWEAEGGVPTAE